MKSGKPTLNRRACWRVPSRLGAMTTTTLSTEELAALEADGFVIRRGVVPPETLDGLRGVFARVVEVLARRWLAEGLISDTCDELPFEQRYAALREQLPTRIPVSWRKILVSREVYGLWQEPALLDVARQWIGDELLAHGTWNGRPREPFNPVQTVGWHQDAHYYKDWSAADGRLLSAWLPLVIADASAGCLQFLRSSHTGGKLPSGIAGNGLHEIPAEHREGLEAITAETRPGDVIFFTDLAVHRALDNVRPDYVRWSIDVRFGPATAAILSKTPRGYVCHSADPSRVEDYETWAARYNYDRASLLEELSMDPRLAEIPVEKVARKLGVSTSDLESF